MDIASIKAVASRTCWEIDGTVWTAQTCPVTRCQSARKLVLLQPALRVPCFPVMSFALLYSLVRFLLDALLTRR